MAKRKRKDDQWDGHYNDEKAQRKEDRIAALYEKGIFEALLPKSVRLDIETNGGRLVGVFTPHDAPRWMAFTFAAAIGIAHEKVYRSDNKLGRRLFNKVAQKMAERAAAVYIEELEERIAEVIEKAQEMACYRGMAEMDDHLKCPLLDTRHILEEESKRLYEAALDRWGIKNQRKPGVFNSWFHFFSVYIEADKRLDKVTQQAVAEEIARMPGFESYSVRQLQRDLGRFKKFLKWEAGRGVVVSSEIILAWARHPQ